MSCNIKKKMDTLLNELSIAEEGEKRRRSRMGGRRRAVSANGEEPVYKSKNLQAERNRRHKLTHRLHTLRSLVPIITNMNKATIVEDAITYIEKLKNEVEALTGQLLHLEAESSQEAAAAAPHIVTKEEPHDSAQEMKKWGIHADVWVTSIDGNKLWIKIVFQKKRGSFSRLMESLCRLGFELTDTSVTTSKGAILVSSCLEGRHGERFGVEETKELLLEIIRDI